MSESISRHPPVTTPAERPSADQPGGGDTAGPNAWRAGGAPRLSRLLPRLVVNVLFPPLAFALLRPHVGNDATALAIGGAIPAAWTLLVLAWRHRVDPIGLVATAGFGIAVLTSVLTGGSALALKLHPTVVVEGIVGAAFLLSVVARRPLLPVLLRLLGRGAPLTGHAATVVTAIVGTTLFVTAGLHVLLALTLATETYLAVSHVVNWVLLGAGVAVLVWYRRRRQRADAERS